VSHCTPPEIGTDRVAVEQHLRVALADAADVELEVVADRRVLAAEVDAGQHVERVARAHVVLALQPLGGDLARDRGRRLQRQPARGGGDAADLAQAALAQRRALQHRADRGRAAAGRHGDVVRAPGAIALRVDLDVVDGGRLVAEGGCTVVAGDRAGDALVATVQLDGRARDRQAGVDVQDRRRHRRARAPGETGTGRYAKGRGAAEHRDRSCDRFHRTLLATPRGLTVAHRTVNDRLCRVP
jgi:hypothetical protein